MIRVVAGFGKIVEAFAALLAKARLGERGAACQKLFWLGREEGEEVSAAKVCWCSFGNSLSKRLSIFGVGTRKQEDKRIVVGLVDVVKSEVVIVSVTLNVG